MCDVCNDKHHIPLRAKMITGFHNNMYCNRVFNKMNRQMLVWLSVTAPNDCITAVEGYKSFSWLKFPKKVNIVRWSCGLGVIKGMQILPEDDTVPLTPLPVAQSGLSSDWPESCGNHGDLYEVSMTEHICGNAIDARCGFVFFSFHFSLFISPYLALSFCPASVSLLLGIWISDGKNCHRRSNHKKKAIKWLVSLLNTL